MKPKSMGLIKGGGAFLAALLLGTLDCGAEDFSVNPPPWARRYQDGERIIYHVKGSNRSRAKKTWIYEFEADGVVRRDSDGNFHEMFGWTNLVSHNLSEKIDLFSLSTSAAWANIVKGTPPLVFPAHSASFRQELALPLVAQPPDFMKVFVAMRTLGGLDHALIAPVADLTTFYVDMLLASRFGSQVKAGDHRYINMGGRPNSWADGIQVVVGEDTVDFNMTVKEIDETTQTAVLLINHVPPAQPKIRLRAEWMRAPVADAANNWVEVRKNSNGTFTAAVGRETFLVQIRVSLVDGRILSARMDNPVDVLERECTDETLANAGSPIRYQSRRQIEIN